MTKLGSQTLALRDELQNPTVITRSMFVEASKAYRKALEAINRQRGVYHELVIELEEAEPHPFVEAKLESLRHTLRALDRQTTQCERLNTTLAQSLRRFQLMEIPDILQAIEYAESADEESTGIAPELEQS